jgi:site-specific DNA-methyltransferase (adenine-specific)
MKGFLTTTEAAQRLGVNQSRVRQLVGEGRLEAEKLGRDLLVSEASVIRYEKERRKAGRPAKLTGKAKE